MLIPSSRFDHLGTRWYTVLTAKPRGETSGTEAVSSNVLAILLQLE